MPKSVKSKRHWITMVFASLAAVVIPLLTYEMLVYRRQADYQLARASRAVAEIEGELSARLKQFKPLLGRTPRAADRKVLSSVKEILNVAHGPKHPCGERVAVLFDVDLEKLSATAGSVTCLKGWQETLQELQKTCQKNDAPRRWKDLDKLWNALISEGTTCVQRLEADLRKTEFDLSYIEAVRQSPGFDRLSINYNRTEGCSGGDTSLENVLVPDSDRHLRVVDCAQAIYAELPLSDLVVAAAAEQPFDGLWLFDRKGEVLFRSGSGAAGAVSALDARALLEQTGTPAAGAVLEADETKPSGGSGPAALPALHRQVDIGGASYEVFVQRLSIPFVTPERKSVVLYLGAATSSDSFRASVMHMRLTVMGAAIVALILTICGLPFLKIVFIGPLEEIRETDLLFLFMGVMVAGGVLAIATLSTLAYRTERARLQDATMVTASSMHREFETELRSVMKTLDPLRTRRSVLEADRVGVHDLAHGEIPRYEFLLMLDARGRMMDVDTARRTDITREPVATRTYFRRVADGKFWEMALAPAGSTTVVNASAPVHFFVERILTLDHGVKHTVVAVALDAAPEKETASAGASTTTASAGAAPAAASAGASTTTASAGAAPAAATTAADIPIVAAMGRHFETFSQRLLPPDLRFAVIEDATGNVLYHSNDSRSLVEKFFEEIDGGRMLRAAVDARRKVSTSFLYHGVNVVGSQRALPFVPWTLVVFADKTMAGTAAFGAGINAAGMFGIYVFAFLVGYLVTRTILGERPWAWAWPQSERWLTYLALSLAVAFVGTAEVVVGAQLDASGAWTVMLATPVLVVTSLFKRLDPHAPQYSRRHRAATGLLLITSALLLWQGWQAQRTALVIVACALAALHCCVWLGPWLAQKLTPKTEGRQEHCFAYAICASVVTLALALPPALLMARDAWNDAAARLALERAAQVTREARSLDRRLDREWKRIRGVRDEHDIRAAMLPGAFQRGWRTLRTPADLADSGSALAGFPPDGPPREVEHPLLRPPLPLAKFDRVPGQAVEKTQPAANAAPTHAAGSNVELRTSLHETLRWLTSALPIVFSDASARLRMMTESVQSAEDGAARDSGEPGLYRWDLAADDPYDGYSAISRAVFVGQWCDTDPIGVTMAILIALVGFFLLVRMVEPLIHRIFALGLVQPLRLGDEEIVPLTAGARLILVDPSSEQVGQLERWARETRSVRGLHAQELLASEAFDMATLNPDATGVLLVRDFEIVLAYPKARLLMLEALERFVRGRRSNIVVLVTDVFPLEWLTASFDSRDAGDTSGSVAVTRNPAQPAPASTPVPDVVDPAAEALRWSALLAGFETRLFRSKPTEETITAAPQGYGQDNPAMHQHLFESCRWAEELRQVCKQLEARPDFGTLSHAQVESELAYRAEPFYRKQWGLCSIQERLALLQLAEGHLPNPRNLNALQGLWRKGMIRREPEVRLVSENFASFVRRAEPPARVAEWRSDAAGGLWAVIRVPLLLTLATMIAFVAYVSREAVDATAGVVVSMATLLPLLARLLSAAGLRASGGSGDAKS